MSGDTIAWLLEGDPSVAWQTKRDLLELPEAEWGPTRKRVAVEGWGKRLLDLQDPEGTWGGGLYQPKWTSTNYTLLQLKDMGLDPGTPQAVMGARKLLDDADWHEGGVSYWSSRLLAERCVNGMVLAIGSFFDVDDDRIDDIAGLLIGARMGDGGWNCRDHEGATHSSFNTTISVLEGLAQWKRRRDTDVADEAIAGGHEFMLVHGMFRSHRTGEIINEAWTRFSFPPRWHYDILRGLDHLRDSAAERDPRAEEAIGIVVERRRPDGCWPIGPRYTGQVHFKMEEGRNPGRWNTLRALRVLKWWESV